MKKYILVLLALALIVCAGCVQQEPAKDETVLPTTEETTVPPTTEETTVPTTTEAPTPELTAGEAKIDQTPAIMSLLMRDDVVDVVGEYDGDHYVVKTDLGYGLVKKVMLRMEGAEPYGVWTGYAYNSAEVYDNFYFDGEPVQKLKLNAKVEVLDDLGWCYVVRIGDAEGFVSKKALAKQKIYYDDSTGKDGGDISLQNQNGISLLAAIEQKGEVTGRAVVLADGAEVVLGYFNRGEEIPVVAEEGFAENWEGFVTVYMDGLYAYVPQELVRPEGSEPYEAWNGYSKWNGTVYNNYHLLGNPVVTLNANVKILVLEELEDCYLVQVNAVTGFMNKNLVSKDKIAVGGTGGGDEWSPPAL